jgi:hypothetical protein
MPGPLPQLTAVTGMYTYASSWTPDLVHTLPAGRSGIVAPGGIFVASMGLSSFTSPLHYTISVTSCLRDKGAQWLGLNIFLLFCWDHWWTFHYWPATPPAAAACCVRALPACPVIIPVGLPSGLTIDGHNRRWTDGLILMVSIDTVDRYFWSNFHRCYRSIS